MSDELLDRVCDAARGADDKLAADIVVIDVGDVLSVTDYFVIASGSSARQVKAIVDGVEERVRAAGGPAPIRVEGADERRWVLMDYGAFVVHVFAADDRDFYQLERLWNDQPRVEWRDPDASSVNG